MVENQDLSTTKEEVLALMAKKSKIQEEIMKFKHVLDVNGVGMHESLVDADGFPRDDIDVYQIRHARHKIICFENDIKALMLEIEKGIHAVHQLVRVQGEPMDQSTSSPLERDCPVLEPFAKVNLVHPNSPAHVCGLLVGDLILSFGSVNDENFSSLKDIASVVEHSVGREVSITVLRNGVKVGLMLTPRTWPGKGLLGCNIVPTESIDR